MATANSSIIEAHIYNYLTKRVSAALAAGYLKRVPVEMMEDNGKIVKTHQYRLTKKAYKELYELFASGHKMD